MRLPCRAMWQQLVLIGQSYVHILIGQFELVASVSQHPPVIPHHVELVAHTNTT